MKAAAQAGQPWSPRWFKLETVERADGRRMGLWRYKVGALPLFSAVYRLPCPTKNGVASHELISFLHLKMEEIRVCGTKSAVVGG